MGYRTVNGLNPEFAGLPMFEAISKISYDKGSVVNKLSDEKLKELRAEFIRLKGKPTNRKQKREFEKEFVKYCEETRRGLETPWWKERM